MFICTSNILTVDKGVPLLLPPPISQRVEAGVHTVGDDTLTLSLCGFRLEVCTVLSQGLFFFMFALGWSYAPYGCVLH